MPYVSRSETVVDLLVNPASITNVKITDGITDKTGISINIICRIFFLTTAKSKKNKRDKTIL